MKVSISRFKRTVQIGWPINSYAESFRLQKFGALLMRIVGICEDQALAGRSCDEEQCLKPVDRRGKGAYLPGWPIEGSKLDRRCKRWSGRYDPCSL
jgi:hypothetical protein